MNEFGIPIAASGGTLNGLPGLSGQSAEDLLRGLATVRQVGFDHIELNDSWLGASTPSDQVVDVVAEGTRDLGLTVIGLTVLGFERATTAIELASRFGAPFVCLGLHAPQAHQRADVSFWLYSGDAPPLTGETLRSLTRELRDVCAFAAERGVTVTLEMSERSVLSNASNVLAVLDAVGAENLGVNPDLGNLTRVPKQLTEKVHDTIRVLAPRTNYWHVKNHLRLEHPSGLVLTHPSALEDGFIDYRGGLGCLLDHGFAGPIVIESYWGDRIGFLRRGRLYVESLLEDRRGVEALLRS